MGRASPRHCTKRGRHGAGGMWHGAAVKGGDLRRGRVRARCRTSGNRRRCRFGWAAAVGDHCLPGGRLDVCPEPQEAWRHPSLSASAVQRLSRDQAWFLAIFLLKVGLGLVALTLKTVAWYSFPAGLRRVYVGERCTNKTTPMPRCMSLSRCIRRAGPVQSQQHLPAPVRRRAGRSTGA